jgi:hypothetical protein
MTPVPQQAAPGRHVASSAVVACLGTLLLALLFLPSWNPVTHRVGVEWRPSVELAGLLFLAALLAAARPQFVARRSVALVLAAVAAAAALLNLADVAAPALLGREINLYWDLRHLPSLFGLARDASGSAGVSFAALVAVGVVILLTAGIYAIWRRVLLALIDRRVGIGAVLLLGLTLDVTAFMPAELTPLATGLSRDIARHARTIERGWQMSTAGEGILPAALAGSSPQSSSLARLNRQDVYLIFVESYGTTVFDTPEFSAALRSSLIQFEAALRGAGYAIASNRLVSPTFGGGSWLAHATLASGVRLDDPVLYAQLLGSGRKLLPSYFKEAGWRAVDIMPGIKAPAPEARAWGFDREFYAAELGYRGPSFGWFAIPDQFTLDRTTKILSGIGAERPIFSQIVLVSSHIPFSPVPPYLADWADCADFATISKSAWEEINRPPDWTALGPDYLKSLRYDFAVLGDWLANHLPGKALVILLGDHQPPAVVGGEVQQWTVPIHVLSRDPELVAPFIAAGYVSGVVPTQAPPHRGMETFLPSFLAAFDRPS